MLQKLASRKLWVAVAGFVTVQVLPNLSTDFRAKYSVAIAAIYVLAQGIADAFGSGTQPSQGAVVKPRRVRKPKPAA